MKKKLMMVTLLLAGFTMGACVDDKESASVTAVRDAKTEQLESVAAMNTAAAQAKQAMAAAEAALRLAEAQAQQAAAELAQAEAEYQKKQAELKELENEQQTIENQRKQAELEKQLADLEVTKKRIEKEMAAIKAQMERAEIEAQTALLNAQAAMNKAQEELLDYEKQLASAKTEAERKRIEAERALLQNLATDYSTAVTNLNNAKSNLNWYKSQLVYAENYLTTLQDGKEALIAQNNNEITQKQIQIDALKKYANYTENIDSLALEYTKLSSANNASRDLYMSAWQDYLNCSVDFQASQALKKEVEKDVFYRFLHHALVDENGDQIVRSDESRVSVHSVTINLFSINESQSPLEYIYEEGDYKYIGYFGDSLYVDVEREEDLRQFELDIEWWISYYKTNLENATNSVKSYQTAYNGEATLGGYPYCIQAQNPDGSLKYNEDGTPVMSTAKCTNLVDSTLNAKAKYEAAAEADKAACRTEYEAALQREQTCKGHLDQALKDQADAQLEVDCFDKEVDMVRNFDTYNAALQEKITARNEQVVKDYEEKVALWYEYRKNYVAWQIAYASFDAVSNIYSDLYSWNWETNEYELSSNGASSIASQIATLEAEIENLKAQIEDVSQIESQEEYIEELKARIEVNEQKVKVAEINANNAKAALEEALAKYGEAEE